MQLHVTFLCKNDWADRGLAGSGNSLGSVEHGIRWELWYCPQIWGGLRRISLAICCHMILEVQLSVWTYIQNKWHLQYLIIPVVIKLLILMQQKLHNAIFSTRWVRNCRTHEIWILAWNWCVFYVLIFLLISCQFDLRSKEPECCKKYGAIDICVVGTKHMHDQSYTEAHMTTTYLACFVYSKVKYKSRRVVKLIEA